MTFINPATATQARDSLQAHPVFQSLHQSVVADLVAHGQEKHLADADILFREQDDASHWWLVLAGGVHLMRFCHDGEERVFACYGAGEVIGEVAMFIPDRRYPVTCRAAGPTWVLQFGRATLHALCLACPQLAINLLGRASQRLSRRVNQLEWMSGTTAAERLADYLLRLQGEQGARLELPFNQRQLAATLGIRAETLSRLLAEWLRAGYIKGGRRSWEICDAPGLARLSRSMGAITLGG